MDLSLIIDELRTELYLMKPSLPPELQIEDHFKNRWGMDSLELVEFVARIEHRFNMLIPDQDLEKCISLSETAAYLHKRLSASS